MCFHVIIPARYCSSRLPGKPLLDLGGKPMVQHVYERALRSNPASICVATDDQRIFDAVTDFGGQVLMTSPNHESGTDRLQEVVSKHRLDDGQIIVNVQGDEPLIPPSAIVQVAENLANNSSASVATLCEPIDALADVLNPNVVKVVTSATGEALYFSRAPIPWDRDGEFKQGLPAKNTYRRHIGLYAYKVGLLHQFIHWPVGHMEAAEKLEQLRVMENGHGIHVALACERFEGGIDTEADIPRVLQLIHSN